MLLIVAFLVAAAAAVRSTWSPCGLSMVSSINPLTERARGHRYGITASHFVVGAVLGGAALGALGGALALLLGALDLSSTMQWSLVCIAAVVGASSDLRLLGWHLPDHPRQVDQAWLSQYRPWVYGVGFGAQIGFGFATYVMTGAVYLMIVLAGLTASPFIAVLVGVTFGLVRGAAVLLGARARTHTELTAVHAFLARSTESVRIALVVVQLAVAALAAVAAFVAGTLFGVAVLLLWTPFAVWAGTIAPTLAAARARTGGTKPHHV